VLQQSLWLQARTFRELKQPFRQIFCLGSFFRPSGQQQERATSMAGNLSELSL